MNDPDFEALRRLADKEAIRDCVQRFARGIDRHDESILRSVFHEDALDNHGDVVLGRDEFATWANEWHTRVSVHHMHGIATHFSDVEGDEAHAVTYILFTLCRKDGKTVHVGGGRYVDRLVRRGEQWRIILRRLLIDWRMNAGPFTRNKHLNKHARGSWDLTDPSYRHFNSSPE
jgi:ketosteroid isomerase-like protein